MPSGPSSRSASPLRSESSRSDGEPDPDTPPRLSLNHLKQGESHQRIRHGAKQLLRLTENFSGYNGPGPEGGYETANDQALPSDSDIRAMTRLSHSIARDISEIMALRKDDPGAPQKRKAAVAVSSSGGGGGGQYHNHAGSHPGAGAGGGIGIGGGPDYASTAMGGRNNARNNRRKVEFACHKCHRVDTPEWRTGPDGPSTLCNVCGLIYAKRERKKEESTMPTFGSPNFS